MGGAKGSGLVGMGAVGGRARGVRAEVGWPRRTAGPAASCRPGTHTTPSPTPSHLLQLDENQSIWGTKTLNDDNEVGNATVVNLAERMAGFGGCVGWGWGWALRV